MPEAVLGAAIRGRVHKRVRRSFAKPAFGSLQKISCLEGNVIAGHSRSKNGVALLAYDPAIHRL
jgi:hypothetical protein